MLKRLLKDQSGAAAAEFALVAAISGAALTFAAVAVNNSIAQSLDDPECVSASVATPPAC